MTTKKLELSFEPFALLGIWAVILMILLTACSNTNSSLTSTPTGQNKSTNEPWIVRTDLNEAVKLVERAKLTCADNSECPENVALMIAVTDKSGEKITYHQCTSFLVGEDVIATNSHCVPVELRKEGAPCKGQIAFVFPSKNGESARAECTEILSASEIVENPSSRDYLRRPDIAFLKLAKPVLGRAPLKFDRTGLPDGLRLRAMTIDPVKRGQLEGSLRVQECSTIQGTFADASYVSDLTGVATASGCEIRTGNSGAPAIDDSGAVRALIFGVLPPEMASMDFNGYQKPEGFQPIAYLTNAACVDIPSGVQVTGAKASDIECSRRLAKDSLRERARKNTNLDFTEAFSAWKQTAPRLFDYKIQEVKLQSNNSVSRLLLPVITCIRDPKQWPSDKMLKQQMVRFEQKDSVIEATVEVPVWAGAYVLDELYRVSIQPKTVDRAVIELRFDSKELSTGLVKTTVTVKPQGRSIKAMASSLTIKKCTE